MAATPAAAQTPLNSMGLPLDVKLPTEESPAFVLYGPPGSGKSLEAARLGARIFYVQTSPDALRMAFDMHRRGLFPLPPIHRLTFDENFAAHYGGGFFYSGIISIVSKFIAACDAGTCEYDGIIFDEWNTILDRVWMELLADPWGQCRSNKNPAQVNPFAVMDKFRAFHSAMLSVARRTRKLCGYVSHYQLPTYFDDGPFSGQIKVPGGPRVPASVKDELMKICAEFSAVLEMRVKAKKSALTIGGPQPVQPAPAPTSQGPALPALAAPAAETPPPPVAAPTLAVEQVDDGSPRVILTQLEPDWFRKIRGYGIKAEEPVTMGKYGLREILERAGFPLPKD